MENKTLIFTIGADRLILKMDIKDFINKMQGIKKNEKIY